jgi:cytochrome c oxidase subunit 2
MKFVPDITTVDMRQKMNNDKFNFVLMCNKICGGAHYKMKMMVVVLSETEYKAWMANKKNQTFKDSYFPSAAPVVDAPVADTLAVAAN